MLLLFKKAMFSSKDRQRKVLRGLFLILLKLICIPVKATTISSKPNLAVYINLERELAH